MNIKEFLTSALLKESFEMEKTEPPHWDITNNFRFGKHRLGE